jgi:hypothetical protein
MNNKMDDARTSTHADDPTSRSKQADAPSMSEIEPAVMDCGSGEQPTTPERGIGPAGTESGETRSPDPQQQAHAGGQQPLPPTHNLRHRGDARDELVGEPH